MKGCKFYIGMMLLLAAGLLVGCSHDGEPTQRREIAVRTGVAGVQRRAAVINNNDDLHTYDLKIDAYYHTSETKYLDGVKLRYDASEWKFWNNEEPGAQVHYYWPFDGSKTAEGVTASTLDFVGFCPFDAPSNIDNIDYDKDAGVSFDCDMSHYMDLAGQDTLQEYLIAVLDSQTLETQTTAGGALRMQFKHPLAQVKFTITAASGEHVQINSIGITATPTSGTCTFNGADMTWDVSGSDVDTMKIAQTLKVGSTTESTPVFIIPDAGTKYLIVNATWDEWSDVTISNYGTDVDFTWEPGRSYTYNLTLDQYGLKVDTVRFTEQW